MSDQAFNVNSFTYYGTATNTSGTTAVDVAKLPDLNKFERFYIQCFHATDSVAIKTGVAGITVGHPASEGTASAMTIVHGQTGRFLAKEKSHTTFAVDSLVGTAPFIVQYGNGDR